MPVTLPPAPLNRCSLRPHRPRRGAHPTCAAPARSLPPRPWNPRLVKAQLPKSVRLHDLRHTCATLLLSKGVHPKIVQELLGHSSISITLDTYSHVLPNMQDKAVQAMDNVLK